LKLIGPGGKARRTIPVIHDYRFATQRDLPAVHALIESAYRGDTSRRGWTTEADLIDGTRTDEAQLTAIIGAPQGGVLLAVDGCGEVLASCHLEPRGGVAYFGMFAVQPRLQAGGIGSAMLTEAERIARDEWRLPRLEMQVIDVRAELIAWYERRGYAATGETAPFPYGEPPYGEPRRPDLHFAVLAKDL
jgi:GNAT superfamily N-acetyltransferase